jgi:hypothetical protein
MDRNKLRVLREIPYVIKATCTSCKHADFAGMTSFFGHCAERTYEHEKHGETS